MKYLLLTVFFTPFLALAAPPRDFEELVGIFVAIINSTIIPVLFAISLVAFLWGVAQYMIFSGSEEKKTSGRQIMVWGIVAFTVMSLVWGIVKIVETSLFDTRPPTPETILI